VTVRINRTNAKVLSEHMCQDSHNEQMAFGLATIARTAEGSVFQITELVLPDASDLAEQCAASVCPSKTFTSYIYYRALQTKKIIVEFHTHPGGGVPHFSGIDDTHAHHNARYIAEKLPHPVTLALIAGNNRFDAHDGVIYDRNLRAFRNIDRFEILGRPNDIRIIGEEPQGLNGRLRPEFDRQIIIPGWNQLGIERQRILIVGLGGNGSPLFQSLISIGGGRQGWIAVVDPDRIESSNLPRIPYATGQDVGTPKVTVAAVFAARRSPGTPVYPYPCELREKVVIDRLKSATVIFGCMDNDGARQTANEHAVRYGIPYIDTGCDIQTDSGIAVAGGQIRTVLPGENACLVCCRGFNPSQAALDQLDPAERALRAARGYVRNSTALATPSVANLNGLTAQFAMAQFQALMNGEQFGAWDYLHFDQFTGRTIPAKSTKHEQCPVCGREGFLGAGDPTMPVVPVEQGKGWKMLRLLKLWKPASKK
jgi:molybdopterin/thiamine biosynthesis adenylyltransferase